ncbi:potassium voltage-gated channel subfamily H member 7 [Ixodes scapularis]
MESRLAQDMQTILRLLGQSAHPQGDPNLTSSTTSVADSSPHESAASAAPAPTLLASRPADLPVRSRSVQGPEPRGAPPRTAASLQTLPLASQAPARNAVLDVTPTAGPRRAASMLTCPVSPSQERWPESGRSASLPGDLAPRKPKLGNKDGSLPEVVDAPGQGGVILVPSVSGSRERSRSRTSDV